MTKLLSDETLPYNYDYPRSHGVSSRLEFKLLRDVPTLGLVHHMLAKEAIFMLRSD